MGTGELLLGIGIALMACAVIGAAVAAAVLRAARRRLDEQMEEEYGPKRQ